MSHWRDALPASQALDALVERVEDSPRVLAVVLTGSWAHEMATEHSDIDVLLVLDRADLGWWRHSADGLDVSAVTLDRLRDVPADPARWWDRYSYSRARILLDRSEGHVDRLLEQWATLTEEEQQAAIDAHIDGYLTYAYRSLKGHRESRSWAARLDAAESLPWALALLFAVHRRVRPANKYLRWELEHHPLEGEGFSAEHVMGLLGPILDDGDPDAQRELFALIEPACRRLGFGGVIDSFGPGVRLLHAGDPA